MRILKWFQQKFVTGEIIRDFGTLSQTSTETNTEKHTLLLSRKSGVDQIVIRHEQRSSFSVDVGHTVIPADQADVIAEKFAALAAFVHTEKSSSRPPNETPL